MTSEQNKAPPRRGMKAKTIKAVIAKKMKHWHESITDDIVKELVKKNTIVTGGCIASMLLGEPVNDFDLYFTNRETVLAVAKYYVDAFKADRAEGIKCSASVLEEGGRVKIIIKSSGIASDEGAATPYEYFEQNSEGDASGSVAEIMQDPGDIEEAYHHTEEAALQTKDEGKPRHRPVFLSTNAITLSGQIQLVLRFYGDADTIHENYDFVHCTNYWKSKDCELVLRQKALEALLARELRYVGSRYPICSIIRLRKFIKRGWTINAGQVLKMAMQVSALDLTDIKTLEDQLTGVDVAYFIQVVDALKEKDPEKVNSAYLIEIIDRMF